MVVMIHVLIINSIQFNLLLTLATLSSIMSPVAVAPDTYATPTSLCYPWPACLPACLLA
jgi:hypothetical protein